MKLLIVDDSTTMRVILKRWCVTLGVNENDILEAENGQTALAQFESNKCDAVVTDWNMPVMDGLTLVKEIRKRNTKVPIIMVTTEADRNQVIAALQCGVNDYLIKPFTPGSLKEKLSKLFGLAPV